MTRLKTRDVSSLSACPSQHRNASTVQFGEVVAARSEHPETNCSDKSASSTCSSPGFNIFRSFIPSDACSRHSKPKVAGSTRLLHVHPVDFFRSMDKRTTTPKFKHDINKKMDCVMQSRVSKARLRLKRSIFSIEDHRNALPSSQQRKM
jgi:hypothetical protein